MPMGKGTYGNKPGRPPKKNGKSKLSSGQKKLPAKLQAKIKKSKMKRG